MEPETCYINLLNNKKYIKISEEFDEKNINEIEKQEREYIKSMQ